MVAVVVGGPVSSVIVPAVVGGPVVTFGLTLVIIAAVESVTPVDTVDTPSQNSSCGVLQGLDITKIQLKN